MVEIIKKNKALAIIILVGLIGTFLRIKMLLDHQSLFLDEANVAKNLFELSYGELFGILKYEQFVPPLFAVSSKFMGEIFGYYEVILRFIPLLSSVLGMYFLYKLLKEFVPIKYIILPITLLAGNAIFLKYSVEIKQYTTEFAIGTFLMWYAVQSKIDDKNFYLKWSIIGIIALYSSFTSIFFLVAIGVYFLVLHFQNPQKKNIFLLFLMGFSWIIAFGIYFYTVLLANVNNAYLMKFHEQFYLRFPINKDNILHDLHLYTNNAARMIKYTSALFFLSLTGLILGYRTFRAKILIIFLPLVLVSIASLLHKFTFINRVVMPFYSIGLVLISLGIFLLTKRLKPKIQNIGIGLSLFLVIGTIQIKYITHTYVFQEMRSAILYIQSNIQDGDEIWAVNGAKPILDYYNEIHPNAHNWSFAQNKIYKKKSWDISFGQHPQKIFVVMASIYDNQRKRALDKLNEVYKQVDVHDYNGVFVYEFVLK